MTQRYASRKSDKNSSETALAAAATFTGKWEDCSSYDTVTCAVKTDIASTLYIEFTSRPESDTVDSSLTYNITAGINEVHRLTITRQFFRLRLVNGSSDQTYLSMDCMLGSHPQLSAPMNLSIGLDADATIVRPTIPSDEIIIGRRTGIRNYTKFGYRNNLSSAGGEETIWQDGGTNFVPMTTASTFTITFNNATDGLGTTGALSLYFDYVDENGLFQETQVTLNASGSQVTTFSGLGINRCSVVTSGTVDTNTNTITIRETLGSTIQATIPALDGTTQQCIFHVDANSDAVARYLWINANKISGGGSPRIQVKGYVYNRQFGSRFEVFRCTIDTSSQSFVSLSEPNGFRLSPTDVLYFVANTDTNNSIVTLRFSLIEYKRN